MSNPDLTDIATRLIELARGLADGQDPLHDQLDQLLAVPAQAAQRLKDAVNAGVAQARKSFDDAVAKADSIHKSSVDQLGGLQQHLVDETQRVERDVQLALQQADQAGAAADRAHQQALAMIDAASDTAAKARTQADATLAEAKAQAQRLRDQAQSAAADAKRQLAETVQTAQQQVDAARASLQSAQDALTAKLVGLENQVTTEVSARLAQVQALPGQLEALADDAMARLNAALTWPAGVLSLVAKALCWLKREFFADEKNLQVVSFAPAAGAHALGLHWTGQGVDLLVAYSPDHPTPTGSLRITASGALNTPISFGSENTVLVTVNGAGAQEIVIGKGGPDPALGPDGLSVRVQLGALKWAWREGPVGAGLPGPVITLDLHHDSAWRYRIAAEITDANASLDPSKVLELAHIPIPVSLPPIAEHRHVKVVLDNGDFTFEEGAAA